MSVPGPHIRGSLRCMRGDKGGVSGANWREQEANSYGIGVVGRLCVSARG